MSVPVPLIFLDSMAIHVEEITENVLTEAY